jgi:hypothetical protein
LTRGGRDDEPGRRSAAAEDALLDILRTIAEILLRPTEEK